MCCNSTICIDKNNLVAYYNITLGTIKSTINTIRWWSNLLKNKKLALRLNESRLIICYNYNVC